MLRNGQSRLTDRLLLARQGHRAGPGSPARQPTIRRASGIARECIGDLLTDDEVGESTAILIGCICTPNWAPTNNAKGDALMHTRYSARRWLRFAVGVALMSMPVTPAWADGDPEIGKQVFKQNCSICHSPLPGKVIVGPPLFGVVGRPTTSVAGYNYSPANVAAHLIWTPTQLDKYIENPQKIVPGTKMTFPGFPLFGVMGPHA